LRTPASNASWQCTGEHRDRQRGTPHRRSIEDSRADAPRRIRATHAVRRAARLRVLPPNLDKEASMRILRTILALHCLVFAASAFAADASRSTGPVFDDFGAVFDDVEADYMPPTKTYRVFFDVWIGPEDASQANPRLESLARFMNMNARAGIDAEDMELAVVLHGSAGRAALTNAMYRKRFGIDNPDLPILEALADKGVRMLFCGQSAAARGYAKSEMIEPIEMAMSAYTAILGLQEEGYRMMPSWE
jgi:intracellular sulfur oxidation DsrE/DsrF family protein